MRRLRTIWLWTVVSMVMSLCSPAVQAAWRCEGRTCGTALFCCCVDEASAGDENCPDAGERPVTAAAGAECLSGCGCVLTVRAFDTHRAAASVLLMASPPALLPIEPLQFGPVLASEKIRIPEERGPPVRAVTLDATAPRGPPSLPILPVA